MPAHPATEAPARQGRRVDGKGRAADRVAVLGWMGDLRLKTFAGCPGGGFCLTELTFGVRARALPGGGEMVTNGEQRHEGGAEIRSWLMVPSGGRYAPSSTGWAELELLMELSSRQHYSARVRSLAPVSSTHLDGGSIAGGGWSRPNGTATDLCALRKRP